MHSSRMHTVRSSGHISGGCTRSWGVPGLRGVYLVWGVGGTWSWGGGVPGLRGCTWSQGVCTWSGGVYLVQGGAPSLGGVPGPGGCTWSQGVYLVRGVYLVPGGVPGAGRGCTWSGTLPRGQTHACKNITFATSLRTVINQLKCQIWMTFLN